MPPVFEFPAGITLNRCLYLLVEASVRPNVHPTGFDKYAQSLMVYYGRYDPLYLWFGWRRTIDGGYFLSSWRHQPIVLKQALQLLSHQPKDGALYRKLL